MKRIFSSLLVIGSLMPVFASFYNAKLDITGRLAKGTIQADVERVQIPGPFHPIRVARNMQELRKFGYCVQDEQTGSNLCKQQSPHMPNR